MQNLDVIWRNLVALLTGTFALSYTALRNPAARALMKGMLLGWLIADPPLSFMTNVLFRQWVGCDGFEQRTERFPYGLSTGCDRGSAQFNLAFYLAFSLRWMAAILIGRAALRERERATLLSRAVAGAGMLTLGTTSLMHALTRLLAGRSAATSIVAPLEAYRAACTYCLAALGASK